MPGGSRPACIHVAALDNRTPSIVLNKANPFESSLHRAENHSKLTVLDCALYVDSKRKLENPDLPVT